MSNFLWNPGVANNGQLTPYITLMSTELNSLASGSGAVSTVNGTAGIFTNSASFTAQAMWGDVWALNGTASVTVSAGGNVACWFLIPNSAGTYETPSATVAPPRPPDVIIPWTGTAAASTVWKSNGVHAVLYPAMNFKVYAQNNLGATMSIGTTLSAGFVGEII